MQLSIMMMELSIIMMELSIMTIELNIVMIGTFPRLYWINASQQISVNELLTCCFTVRFFAIVAGGKNIFPSGLVNSTSPFRKKFSKPMSDTYQPRNLY
jgi:hypothetical protein